MKQKREPFQTKGMLYIGSLPGGLGDRYQTHTSQNLMCV